jgi:hypothetical protein
MKNLLLINLKLESRYDTSSSYYSEIKKKTYADWGGMKIIMDCNSDTNTFGIVNSDYVNFFNQETLKNNRKFYSKENELLIIKDLIHNQVKKSIRSRISNFLAQQENSTNLNLKKKFKSLKNSPMKTSRSKSRDTSPQAEENKSSCNSQRNTTHAYSSRNLYPEPKKHEDLLKTKFVLSKIYEFKFHGNLQKKCDIKELKNEFKLNRDKIKYDLNVAENLEVVDKLMENRKMINLIKPAVRKKATERGEELRRENDIIVDTNSNFYTRIERNNMDLKISKNFF